MSQTPIDRWDLKIVEIAIHFENTVQVERI